MLKTMTIAAAVLIADPASALTQKQQETYCTMSATMTSLILASVNGHGGETSRIAERENFEWHMETFAEPLGAMMQAKMREAYDQFTAGEITAPEAGLMIVRNCVQARITPDR